MCDACPEFSWWAVALLFALVLGPFVLGAALPIVAGVVRGRIGRGLVLAGAALIPAGLFYSGNSYLVPFLGFPQLAFTLVEFGRAPLAEITSLVIGATGAASLLAARPAHSSEPTPR